MQELLAQIRNNPVTCRILETTIEHWDQKLFKIDLISNDKVVPPPEVEFALSKQTQQKLKEKLERSRKGF